MATKRIAEMLVARFDDDGEVAETGMVLSLRGHEAALLERRPDLARWRQEPSELAPELTIWTPPGSRFEAIHQRSAGERRSGRRA